MTANGNLSALAETYTTTQNTYGNGSFSGNVIASFLENHDQPRFGGQTKDQAVSILLLCENIVSLPCSSSRTPWLGLSSRTVSPFSTTASPSIFVQVPWLTVLQVRSKATRAVLTLPTVRRTCIVYGLGVCVLI